MDKEKVLDLAKLARIGISETEAEKLSYEFEAILGYVSEVKSVKPADSSPDGEERALKNVLREDGEPHEKGIYTDKILEQAPSKEGKYFKVKKILS